MSHSRAALPAPELFFACPFVIFGSEAAVIPRLNKVRFTQPSSHRFPRSAYPLLGMSGYRLYGFWCQPMTKADIRNLHFFIFLGHNHNSTRYSSRKRA
jgi:hypothetical protein